MSEKIERICKGCGKTFAQDSKKPGNKYLYCSEVCRISYWRRQDHEMRAAAHEKLEEKPCLNCGKEFRAEFGHGDRQKFCSDQCRKEGKLQ